MSDHGHEEYKNGGSASPRSRSRSYRSRSRSGSVRRSVSRSRSRSYRSRSGSRRRRSPTPERYGKRRSRYNSRSRSRSRSYSRGRDSRSPMSSRKRHIGDRMDPPKGKCLGVFGLSLYTTESDLRSVFSRYGRISNINIVMDQKTGRSRGFGFVYFDHADDAAEAKERANGMELDERKIRVDFSITKRPHTPTPGVYVGRPYSTRPPPRDFDRFDRGGGGGGGRYGRDDYYGGRSYGRRSPSPYSRRRSPSPYYSRGRRSPSPYYRDRSPRRY